MSDSGWGAGSWGEGDEPRARLPRIEDLQVAEQGYDRAAVEAAFDSFYRHAAQLDATLRVVESIEAFQRQAGDLRADIRALRAASWGPIPDRPVWGAAYGTAGFTAESRRGRVPEAVPRLVVEAAFIIVVAVGAAIGGLETGFVVMLVIASWLVVGLGEIVLAAARPAIRRPAAAEPTAAPIAPAEEQPASAVEPVAAPVGEATMLELAVGLELEEQAPEEQPAVAEDVAGAEPPLDPDAAPMRPEPQPKRRRRFWRRGDERELEPADEEAPRHVRVLPVEKSPLAAVDPWEEGPELPETAPEPGPEGLAEASEETEEPSDSAELEESKDSEEPEEAESHELDEDPRSAAPIVRLIEGDPAQDGSDPLEAGDLEPVEDEVVPPAARALPDLRLRRGRR